MEIDRFNDVVERQLDVCKDVLVDKARQYASGNDKLHNFRSAAVIEHTTMRQALAGMMAKHTISVYDLCAAPESASLELWDEKITDHINYLILLRAVVAEEADNQAREEREQLSLFADDLEIGRTEL